MKKDLTKDLVMRFGNLSDGAIGIPCLTEEGHVVEASYFYGNFKPKNIICVSSQASCPMKCDFCELGSERFLRNLTPEEMFAQARFILDEAKHLGFSAEETPHKINIANSGEPLLNPDIVEGMKLLSSLGTSFKVSTIIPRGDKVLKQAEAMATFASSYNKPIQLQISLISTSEPERIRQSGRGAADFATVRKVAEIWQRGDPFKRKTNLSLILSEESQWDLTTVYEMFPPDWFRFRFREYVPTANGQSNGLHSISEDRLWRVKNDFRGKGYDVFDDASPTSIEKNLDLWQIR